MPSRDAGAARAHGTPLDPRVGGLAIQAVAPLSHRVMIVMDSGLGGLSVVRAIRAARPELALTYVADTAGFPYGRRAPDALERRAAAILRALLPRSRPRIVVLACNTLSTLCLDRLRDAFDVPFVGTVPAVKVAAQTARRFTLLATPNTAHGTYSLDLIARFASHRTVDRHGAPGLAVLAEHILLGQPVARDALAAELAPAFHDDAHGRTEAIVLGCTHYPLILDALRDAAPWPVAWIEPGDAIARRALELADGTAGPSMAYVTGAGSLSRYGPVFAREGFDGVRALDMPAF